MDSDRNYFIVFVGKKYGNLKAIAKTYFLSFKKMTRILLTGAEGQVGQELQQTLPILGEVIALNRQQADLSQPDSLRDLLQSLKPDLIVNAAAYTAVDKAESEVELCHTINAIAQTPIETTTCGASLRK